MPCAQKQQQQQHTDASLEGCSSKIQFWVDFLSVDSHPYAYISNLSRPVFCVLFHSGRFHNIYVSI